MYTCGINIGLDCENIIMSFIVNKKHKKCMNEIEKIQYKITKHYYIGQMFSSTRDKTEYLLDYGCKHNGNIYISF